MSRAGGAGTKRRIQTDFSTNVAADVSMNADKLGILHVVSTLDPAAGGPPQVAARLAAAQAALGHRVSLLSYSSASDQARVSQQIARVPHHERVEFVTVADPDPLERLLARRARRLLRQHLRGAEFVHVHGVWGALPAAAASLARASGVPYCFQPHGMLDPWSLAQRRLKKRLALALQYRALLNGAAFIHTLNDDERRLIAPLRLTAEAVVIPNGVFLEELEPLPERGAFRRAHPALQGAPYVLFLSRLHHKKGLDVLAEAFRVVAAARSDVHLVVAGPDEGAGRDFEQRIASSGLASRVHLVGPLYGADKFAAFVDAACFCLPSRQEGFSVAITEAMACGLPVVISEACHFPEVATAQAGLITSLEPVAVAGALRQILDDPAAATRRGAAGAALVRQRYTWQAVATECLLHYARAQRRR